MNCVGNESLFLCIISSPYMLAGNMLSKKVGRNAVDIIEKCKEIQKKYLSKNIDLMRFEVTQ